MDPHHISFQNLFNGHVQYVVPRWQRRYCWGQSDIQRLVEDLVTVARARPGATHYGGNLLTFPESGAAGVMNVQRVVDGQQRLTTVSILLACIADKLGEEGKCGDWTAEFIREHRLTNPGMSPEKRLKLRLQNGDDKEYRSGLEGNPSGAGAVAQAWKIMRRLVARKENDVALLLSGLERLRVVSIGLDGQEDPQQIFESLNATGRPLTESEKVKNWLLIGLPDAEQRDLHDNHWLRIEKQLGAEQTSEPIDLFLRDFLRWRTGETHGMRHAYEVFRRWAVRTGHVEDRPALCRELARLAKIYGVLTGTAGKHPDRRVERELRHMRAMGIDIHRPLTLRLLAEDAENGRAQAPERLAETLRAISTWITRLWLADRPLGGLNKAMADLAHGPGPGVDGDYADYWIGRIRKMRNSRVRVPSDEGVREGIRTRSAYGGSSTRSSFAVLCELMEAEHGDEAPARRTLTIEHVMPQKLTDEWKQALGDAAEETHGLHCNRLANLTLSGDTTNAKMGAGTFEAKCRLYRKSSIAMTRRIAEESEWNQMAIERRAEEIAHRALKRWPWEDPDAPATRLQADSAQLQWRIEDSPWQKESSAAQMVLNVAAALLSRDPANAERLSGEALSSNLHQASRYPAGSKAGSLTMRAVPGHSEYVLNPYEQDYSVSAKRCQDMGNRCGVQVEVTGIQKKTRAQAFWEFLQEHKSGLPGQKDAWKGPNQWTSAVNSLGDRVGIWLGAENLWLYLRAVETQHSEQRAARMQGYSRTIRDQMGDQELGQNIVKESEDGRSISVWRNWELDNEDDWPEIADWIMDQFQRLRAIAAAS